MSVDHFSLIIFIYHYIYIYTANQNPFVLGPLCGNVNVMEVFRMFNNISKYFGIAVSRNANSECQCQFYSKMENDIFGISPERQKLY